MSFSAWISWLLHLFFLATPVSKEDPHAAPPPPPPPTSPVGDVDTSPNFSNGF